MQDSDETPAAPPPPTLGPEAAADEASAGAEDDPIVQFVVVRRDLLKTLDWPVGSVIAQACHACVAVVQQHLNDEDVQAYVAPSNLDSMYKVVKEVKGEPQLRTLAEKLTAEGIAHKLWVEQPEAFPTAIALKPYPRSRVAPLLKKYQLFK
jgi:peptidyl-tRNA hydrolase